MAEPSEGTGPECSLTQRWGNRGTASRSGFLEVLDLGGRGWDLSEMKAFVPPPLERMSRELILICCYKEQRASVSELRDGIDGQQ